MEGSLVSEFVRCTQSGELNSASCIWSRHQVIGCMCMDRWMDG